MSLRKGNTLISGVGIDGINGVSPTASVSKVGSISTLTVTDANGTTSTQILDGGQIIQYSVMPTASSSNVGDIIQFTGTTDSTYINGYFYKCVDNSGTYSWENINIQKSSPQSMYFLEVSEIKNNYNLSTAEKANLLAILKDMESTQIIKPILVSAMGSTHDLNHGQYILRTGTNWLSLLSGSGVTSIEFFCEETASDWSNPNMKSYIRFLIGITKSNGTIASLGNVYFLRENKTNLTMNNTEAFFPTANSYNPAHTKYAEKMVESVAPVYSSNSTYAIGDYVSYQGKLYVCSTTISSAEAWNSSHWTETTVMSIVGNLETALSNITTGNGV